MLLQLLMGPLALSCIILFWQVALVVAVVVQDLMPTARRTAEQYFVQQLEFYLLMRATNLAHATMISDNCYNSLEGHLMACDSEFCQRQRTLLGIVKAYGIVDSNIELLKRNVQQ